MKKITRVIAFIVLLALITLPISIISVGAVPAGTAGWENYRGACDISYTNGALRIDKTTSNTSTVYYSSEEYTYYEMTADMTVTASTGAVSFGLVYRASDISDGIHATFLQKIGTGESNPRALKCIKVNKYLTDANEVSYNDEYTPFAVGDTVGYKVIVSQVEGSNVVSAWSKVYGKDDDYVQYFENVPVAASVGESGYVGFFMSQGTIEIDNVVIKNTVTNQTRTFNFDNIADGDGFTAIEQGASVRMTTGSTGLRFHTNIEQAAFDAAVVIITPDSATTYDVSFGTIIAPKAYVDEAGEFTLGALDALAKTSKKYLIAPTSKTMDAVDGVYTITGSITNLGATAGKNDHRALDFAAIVYICATDTVTGIKTYIYADSYSVRNVSDVASAALNDVSEVESIGYTYVIESGMNSSKYSPYTTEQRAIIDTLVVSTID